jgi:arylsulfatase A-like enzyme
MGPWRDGSRTLAPHRSGGEKATTWEGGVRVPMLVRWPTKIPAGKVSNGIQDNTELFVTLSASAGIPDIAQKLKVSHKVHIDGVNNLKHWTSDAPSARNVYIYYYESQLTVIA